MTQKVILIHLQQGQVLKIEINNGDIKKYL